MVKLYVVLLATLGVVPDITPVLAFIVALPGNVPLAMLYEIGASPVAAKLAVKLICLL
jgi:hypothetical protein